MFLFQFTSATTTAYVSILRIIMVIWCLSHVWIQYIPNNIHTSVARCFVAVIASFKGFVCFINLYSSGLLRWYRGNLKIGGHFVAASLVKYWFVYYTTATNKLHNTTQHNKTQYTPALIGISYTCIRYGQHKHNFFQPEIKWITKVCIFPPVE